MDSTTQSVAPSSALYPPTVSCPREPLPLHRFLFRFVDNPLASVPQLAYEQPMTVAEVGGGIKVAWVSGPELTEQILIKEASAFNKSDMEKRVFRKSAGDGVLTADGPHWRWQRRAMAPLFRHADILSYVPTMSAVATEAADRWVSPGRREIDDDMIAATFAVISRTMLDDGEPDETQRLIAATHDYLAAVPWEMAWEIFSLPEWLPHPASWRMSRAARKLRSFVAAIIERRKSSPEAVADDLLERLLATRNPDTGAPMSDDQLIDNLLTLLEAGHETTARALTFTLYLLARAPDWQDKVRAEILNVCGDGNITASHMNELTVTKQVLEESMRLYPPAPVVARRAIRPITIGDVTFSPRDQIIIPIFAIHRHRQLWDDPDKFDPDRFAPDAIQDRPRTQYLPFGAGPRICLGQSFALIEAIVLLATFVRKARFEWDGHYAPEPVSRVTLRPRGGMPLTVVPF
ncbi:MAG: cytochrome P450 [Pseudomonadota bacterium]